MAAMAPRADADDEARGPGGRAAAPSGTAQRAQLSPRGLAEHGTETADAASSLASSSSKAHARLGLSLDGAPRRSQSPPCAGLGGDAAAPLSHKARRKMGLSLDGVDEGAGGAKLVISRARTSSQSPPCAGLGGDAAAPLSDKARRKMGLSLDGVDEGADGANSMISRARTSSSLSPRSGSGGAGGGSPGAPPASAKALSRLGLGEDGAGGGDVGGSGSGGQQEDADGTFSASSGERSEHLQLKALGLLGLGLSEENAAGRLNSDLSSSLAKALARMGVNDSAGLTVAPRHQSTDDSLGTASDNSQGRRRGTTDESLSASTTAEETEQEFQQPSPPQQQQQGASVDRAAFEGAPLWTRSPALFVFSAGGLRHRLRCGVLEQLGDGGQWARVVVMGELSAATRCENALRLWRHSNDVVTLFAQTRAAAEAWRSAIVAHAQAWAPPRPAGLALRPIILSNVHPVRDNCAFGAGDVLLFKIPRFSANVQRFFTNSEWDHVGIVVPIEWGVSFQFGDFAAERWALLEATPEGVISCPLAARVRQYLAETGARACVRHLDGPLARDGVDNLHHLFTCATGRPYSYRKMMQTGESGQALPYDRAEQERESEQGYFCSYLCALALLSLNVIDTDEGWASNAYWPVSFTFGDAIDRHLRPAFALSPPLEVDVA
jgi:hypothetical protein